MREKMKKNEKKKLSLGSHNFYSIVTYTTTIKMKTAFAFAALVSGAVAFNTQPAFRASTALFNGPVK
jgi:hypothetical protein